MSIKALVLVVTKRKPTSTNLPNYGAPLKASTFFHQPRWTPARAPVKNIRCIQNRFNIQTNITYTSDIIRHHQTLIWSLHSIITYNLCFSSSPLLDTVSVIGLSWFVMVRQCRKCRKTLWGQAEHREKHVPLKEISGFMGISWEKDINSENSHIFFFDFWEFHENFVDFCRFGVWMFWDLSLIPPGPKGPPPTGMPP